jgi:uncharacterized protein (DUF1800 family)
MASNHPLLEKYVPTDSDPFDGVKAAHLLSRAGFGGTLEEIEHVRSIGPEAAADELLDFPDVPAEEESETDLPDLSAIEGLPKTFRDIQKQISGTTDAAEKQKIRQKINQANMEVLMTTMNWWMKRMAFGQYPMQEKLTLFWHGHFTTSAKDEHMAALMWRQNELLRSSAAGNFATLVHAISRDPAMLDYLNNTQNRKEHPNENYARELMELFTLGIGHYTENDVKQGARAFTGWTHDGDDYTFRPSEHDYGFKTYLGYSGDFNGDDVVDIILRQPNCAPFIAGELYKYFVSEDVDPAMSQALGKVLLENKYELRPLLRTMLTSKAFYQRESIGVQIKSPVQLLTGTIRMLGLDMPPQRAMVASLTQMGQVPFMPPNVRGWVGGHSWINTSTVFVRYNAGVWLTGGQVPGLLQGRLTGKEIRILPDNRGQAAVTFAPASSDMSSAEGIVDHWLARLIQRPVDPKQKQILVDALGEESDEQQSLRRLAQLIMSMPEYQLC